MTVAGKYQYRWQDPAVQAKSMYFQEGYERGLNDRLRLARGLDPRGISRQRRKSVLYEAGYSKGLTGRASVRGVAA